MHSATNIKTTRDVGAWEVEVKAEIPAEALLRYRAETLKELTKTAKLDGFRPGKAPESEILRVYGEQAILRQAAERAIQHELPEILAGEKLPIIETPRVTTDAPQAGNALAFTARAALAPKVELPDYKKIAARHPPASAASFEVSDEEHLAAMTHLRRERARIDKVEAGGAPAQAVEDAKKMEEKNLPALDDEFSKSIGYESAAHFTDTLRANMKEEKARTAAEKRRAALLDDLVKEAVISYPALLREFELDDMENHLKDDLVRMGTTFDAYLAQAKKTREQIRTEWKAAADKRARIRLLLAEIARIENIEPDPEALEKEVGHAKKHYSQADPGILKTHIAHAMRNDATLKFLEASGAN